MKVLFLDIDGVLNSSSWINSNKGRKHGEFNKINPWCVENLNKIIDAIPDLKIVLSSSWRILYSLEEVQAILKINGFKSVLYDKTSNGVLSEDELCIESGRGTEIKLWLTEHPECKQFAIVDDEISDMKDLLPYIVQTNFFEAGLEPYHAEELIKKLMEN